jgi:hypothetical protein
VVSATWVAVCRAWVIRSLLGLGLSEFQSITDIGCLHATGSNGVDCCPTRKHPWLSMPSDHRHGALAVKGFTEPVAAWCLAGLRRSAPGRPFVGRRDELRQFRAVLESCRETGCGNIGEGWS